MTVKEAIKAQKDLILGIRASGYWGDTGLVVRTLDAEMAIKVIEKELKNLENQIKELDNAYRGCFNL